MDQDPSSTMRDHGVSATDSRTSAASTESTFVLGAGENLVSNSRITPSFSVRWAKSFPTLLAPQVLQYSCLTCNKSFGRRCDLKSASFPPSCCEANRHLVAIIKGTLVHTSANTVRRPFRLERIGTAMVILRSMASGQLISAQYPSVVLLVSRFTLSAEWIAGGII